jgi:hypothetical protein
MEHKNQLKIAVMGLAAGLASLFANYASAQTYTPSGWVSDPYSQANANFILGGTSSSPTYTDNGTALGGLYGFSPIGATLDLVNPGDNITYSGDFSLAGTVNNGNLQVRMGLLYQGAQPGDTGWLGFLVALPNAANQNGLYQRQIPNTGAFGSGTGATTTSAGDTAFTGPVAVGTYDFSLSITLSTPTSETIAWDVAGIGSNPYVYTGSYVNTSPSTLIGTQFDKVGFLAGGSTWSGSASTADVISINTLDDTTVTLTTVPEPSTIALGVMGASALLFRRRK